MDEPLKSRHRFQWATPFALSVALGLIFRAITPYTVEAGGERYRYVEMSRHFPMATCPSFHCFRILPPLLTRLIPLPTIPAFLVTGLIFQMLAGVCAWRIAERLSGSRRVGLLTTLWFWGSWTSIQALAEPLLIADPVQAFWSLASLDLLLSGKFRTALVLLTAGAAVKESVLLVPCIYAAYVYLVDDPARRRPADLFVLIALPIVCWLAIRAVLSERYWYALFEDPAYLRATYFFGLWFPNLSYFPRNVVIAAIYIFGAFGVAWVLAAVGFRSASREQRALTIASIAPMIFLALYQVPDRALASFPYAVLSVAAAYTASLPLWWNVVTIAANAMFTERVAASAGWAPRLPFAAAGLGIILIATLWKKRSTARTMERIAGPA